MRRHLSRLAIIFAALFLASSCLSARRRRRQRRQAATAASSAIVHACRNTTRCRRRKRRKIRTAQLKLLDAFVAQYPNSTLMEYIYQMYYQAYYKLKNLREGD